ncbi:restriction endonuclease subunit S [Rhodococcus maanshanensis]|uniref:restriction endonuclease subunit S n=1 Tax=Rhodococcus maanshanensis TaxID=183556 RepID=UPI0022B2FDA5|nr:restriction endonuclease subunit S [Rhodococcus maanshanensis]MCZ4558173.1 restriction endonuclease subunit S [Rhodococcus maanshanensis]
MSSSGPTVPISDLADINPPTVLPSCGLATFVGMEDVSERFMLTHTSDRDVRASSGYTRFREGDLLFAKITPCMENGKGAQARGLTNGIGFGSTEFHVLRATTSDARFIAQWLQSRELRLAAETQMTGSAGQRRVPTDFFNRYQVPLFPITEQRRIAEILDALDDQICTTEQIIVKLNAIKNGLLERLLTQGSPRSVLGDGLAGSPANGIYKPASMLGRGELLVGQTAFTDDRRVDPLLARKAIVSRAELDRFGITNGDILVSRVFATLSGVGQPAYVDSLDQPATFESNMMRLRANPGRADSFFLFQLLQTASARSHIIRNANLSNQASISQGVLTSMPVFLPPLPEQTRISEVLMTADLRRNTYRRELRKLSLLKNALMADLLTGRVRVLAEAEV